MYFIALGVQSATLPQSRSLYRHLPEPVFGRKAERRTTSVWRDSAIADTILEEIEACEVFVGDVTITNAE
jgi:hypothetical protein